MSLMPPTCAMAADAALPKLGYHCLEFSKLQPKRSNIVGGPGHDHSIRKHPQVTLFKHLAPPLIATVFALSPISISNISAPPKVALGQTMDAQKAGALFRRACIGCHDGGGNIIQPGATLFLKDLQRNGVGTEEEIYQITYFGKRRMPGFGENCTPRGQCTFGPRLQEDEIKLLAEFVKSQADQNWPPIEINGD
ncbi:cytochrome c6, chloroplastic [Dorcoceras hygrometricum]|uniref:Cytochrome c-553 n=1 Tax=Dorcoceras hygrometricum TaxID=472368 RepID=A0A2Z7C6I7_9LAMI|nr:cytochrome c6, chloroplastic [Dorcoceras hygrometricum]